MAVKKTATIWIGLFVIAMIGIVLMQETADTTTKLTTAYTSVNETKAGAAAGVNTTLKGKNTEGTPIVMNHTNTSTNGGYTTVAAGNYTIAQRTRSGKQVVEFQLLTATFGSQPLNVTYTWHPEGYISDPAGRNVTGIIILILAVALIIFVLVSLFEMDGLKAMLGIGRS